MSARIAVLLLAIFLTRTGIPPALAQSDTPSPRERAEELTREGAERFLEALEFLMMTIPQYDLPEITEDGDIIIRRRRPGATPPAPEDNDPTMDQT